MGRDCTLRLKATIDPQAGKVLATLCRDWAFIRALENPPADDFWQEIYEGCQNVFNDLCTDDAIDPLESGHLDLTFDGKYDDDGVDILEHRFLPKVLVELKSFYYVIPEFDLRVDFAFDPKKRLLTKTESKLDPDEAEADDSTEVEFATPREWRARLVNFLEFLSDLEKQKKVLHAKSETCDFDPPFSIFEIWFDVHTYYMERLHLEDGAEPLVAEGFLNAEEAKALAPLDKLFQNFFPDDLMTDRAMTVLTDPQWIKIVEIAAALNKKKLFA
jgi:hypothetical protein